jgi:predicted ATPase/DNA-binding transcriptional regulator YiaG
MMRALACAALTGPPWATAVAQPPRLDQEASLTRSTDRAPQPPAGTTARPRWNEVLRALREVRGVTQEGWAAQIGVSRKTVQRWEAGERAPDPGAEAAILAYCRERDLFRAFSHGPLAGLELTPDVLHDVLAESRIGGSRQPAAGRGEPVVHAQPAARPPQPSNVPAALTRFVGREREISSVRRSLAGTRLLTLTGAGGCGKTRLALEVAGELLWAYPHGVCLVELAALTNHALVPGTVAATLGLRELEARPATEALVDLLRSRHLLLILDNCEHLLVACAELVEMLLRACPNLEVLATSRESLGIVGETVWQVPPMALPPVAWEFGVGEQESVHGAQSPMPDALRLFVERAQLYRSDFNLTSQNAGAVAGVCRRLDGIPLAIELAAAWVRVLSIDQIAARLGDRFHLLTGGGRAALPRHQTLRAAMDWSHDLLTPPERALLRRLSVFAGGFTLEAAEAVCGAVGTGAKAKKE